MIAFLVPAVAPAGAKAATSPVLEFAVPGDDYPVAFEADGGEVTAALAGFVSVVHCTDSRGDGVITGPRQAVSSYEFTGCKAQGGAENGAECRSEGADAEEIRSETLDAELVFIDQAKHQVGMLLNPQGGTYMNFECGEEPVEASGPFLSPVGQINQVATSFTATLSRSGVTQTPNEYENAYGEKRPAIPLGRAGTDPWGTSGVELEFAIETSVPLEVRAITTAEIEAAQRQQETLTAEKRRQEEEAAKAAAAKERQEHEAAAAAAKLLQEEQQAQIERLKRRLALSNGLLRCRKLGTKNRRVRCEKRVKRKHAAAKRRARAGSR